MSTTDSLGDLLTRSLRSRRAEDDPTGRRIIDATVDELRRGGLRRLTIDGVAERAGTSRITVYRRFGDRNGLIEATLSRETDRFLGDIAAADDERAPVTERIAASFAVGVQAARRHPLVSHWLMTDPGVLVDELLADDGRVLRAGTEFIAQGIRELDLDGTAAADDPERTAELLVRLFAAMVVMPPPSTDLDDTTQVEALARQLVVPVLLAPSGPQ